MTLLETVVVMVVLAVLVVMLLPAIGSRGNHNGPRIRCINNLKQIGTAYRIWENDNGDKYPMQQIEALGGMSELLSNSINAGRFAYLPYALMANELGQSPKVLICPSDERSPNTNFCWGMTNGPTETMYVSAPFAWGSFDNTNVSYFCGVGASDTSPQSILGGDRNLGNGGTLNSATGTIITTEQDPDFGISGTTANPDYPCGADAIINTNGIWSYAAITRHSGSVSRTHAIGWSGKMHSGGNIAGAGNIMLGDGSAQQCTSAGLRQTWLVNASDLGNFAAKDIIHSTNHGDIRLLFP